MKVRVSTKLGQMAQFNPGDVDDISLARFVVGTAEGIAAVMARDGNLPQDATEREVAAVFADIFVAAAVGAALDGKVTVRHPVVLPSPMFFSATPTAPEELPASVALLYLGVPGRWKYPSVELDTEDGVVTMWATGIRLASRRSPMGQLQRSLGFADYERFVTRGPREEGLWENNRFRGAAATHRELVSFFRRGAKIRRDP